MTIHNEIMNIPCEPIEGTESEVLSFKLGHKQARHAAAELAARLSEWQNEAAALLATFIGLSSRPDELEWSKVAIKVPALLAEEEAYEKTDLVPGVVHCARCNFRLNRVTLYMGNGAIGPGGSETEKCPNGCGPMWPVTWKQEAEDAYKTAESQFERAKAAEDQLNACRPYLKEGETPAECLARNRADIARLMGKWGAEKMRSAKLRDDLDKIAQTTGSDDPCRQFLKEGETPAECLARNRLDIDRLMGFLATEKTARENLQADAARYRWLCEHPKLVGHCFGYLDYRPDQIDAAIDRARAAQEVE